MCNVVLNEQSQLWFTINLEPKVLLQSRTFCEQKKIHEFLREFPTSVKKQVF